LALQPFCIRDILFIDKKKYKYSHQVQDSISPGVQMDEKEEDIYVRYLHQLFHSCDTRGDGLLGKEEISQLCDKLQLTDPQFWYISDRLIGDDTLIQVSPCSFQTI
jgi:hypothetical protein